MVLASRMGKAPRTRLQLLLEVHLLECADALGDPLEQLPGGHVARRLLRVGARARLQAEHVLRELVEPHLHRCEGAACPPAANGRPACALGRAAG